jgi:hypothetical protein
MILFGVTHTHVILDKQVNSVARVQRREAEVVRMKLVGLPAVMPVPITPLL